jgi:hypothetical protein
MIGYRRLSMVYMIDGKLFEINDATCVVLCPYRGNIILGQALAILV